jgi:hypothetical protein
MLVAVAAVEAEVILDQQVQVEQAAVEMVLLNSNRQLEEHQILVAEEVVMALLLDQVQMVVLVL